MCTCSDVDFGLDLDVWWERWVVQETEGAGCGFWAVAVGEPFEAFGWRGDLMQLVLGARI